MLDAPIDLSLPIYEGMPTDDEGPRIWSRMTHEKSRDVYGDREDQTRASRFLLTTDHVGTHLDGPLRFDPNGSPVEQLPIDRVIRPGRLIDLRAVGRGEPIGPAELEGASADLQPGDAAVLWTGHDRNLKSPDYFWHRPWLTTEGAAWLVRRQVGIVAADFPGIGRPGDAGAEAKRALHRGGVLTAEQLCNLAPLSGKAWHLFVAPLRVRGAAGSLIRAVGLVGWTAREVVDLSLDVYQGMPMFGGAVSAFWTRTDHRLTSFYAGGEHSTQTNFMLICEHTGTHLDAPFHYDQDGPAIDQMPLGSLVKRARVLNLTHKQPREGIGAADLEAAARRDGIVIGPDDAAVIWTGHSRNFGQESYLFERPFIAADGADWIVAQRPGMVVTDLIGLDEPADMTSPIHNRFLRNGIPQLQVTTNLHRLAEGEAYVCAFPLKLLGGTGSPLRAFAALA